MHLEVNRLVIESRQEHNDRKDRREILGAQRARVVGPDLVYLHATGMTRVFVVTPANSQDIVAYYAWTMAQIELDDAPARLREGAGRYPQPVALLARMGVHDEHESAGLGAGLLRDVIERVAATGDDIGCRGLLVHCESERARNFYRYLVPEFETSPSDELHLVLLLKDIRRTFTARPR